MYFIKPFEKTAVTEDKPIDPIDGKPTEEKKTNHKVVTIVLLSICLSSINSMELVYFNFGSTYFQYIPLKLSAQTSARLVSVMSASYTCGQVINFFVSFLLRTEFIIGTHFLMTFAVFVCLQFAQNTEHLLWFVSAGIGFSVSVLFPGVIGFFGNHLKITDRIATTVWISAGVVSFIHPVILGHFLQTKPFVFIIIELSYTLIAFLSFVTFLLIKNKLT